MNTDRSVGLILAALGLGVLWLAVRRGWLHPGRCQRPGVFLPASAPPAARIARIVETTVLGAAGILILAIAATSRSTGGYLLMLDEISPAYATVNVLMFLGAAAGVALALVIAYRGRTAGGALVLTLFLIAYGLALNAGSYAGKLFVSAEIVKPVIEYTMDVSGENVRGAELWVNGVCLGKTPFRTTMDAFEATTPYWPEPPSDYETDKGEIPRYEPRGVNVGHHRRWTAFMLPARRDGDYEQRRKYYARVRYAGEWGLWEGNSSSGSGGSAVTRRAYSVLGVVFPERQKRLDALLDKARLAGYDVTPEWFQTIETYDEDGWIALRRAVPDEPEMMAVLDAWATWRYGLDKVTDADSAWRAFEGICEEADAKKQYLTPSVAGRAVELLVSKLPEDRLLDRAVRLIRSAGLFHYLTWRMNGRLQFGYVAEGRAVSLGGDGGISSRAFGGKIGSRPFPASGFPVAHAVWALSEQYAADPSTQPNVIQQRIAPELVRWHSGAGLPDPLLVAASFGGPGIDRFLLRQNWWTDGRGLDWEDRLHTGGREVNKWLYALAHLNGKAGHEFRCDHAAVVMDMADTACLGGSPWPSEEDVDFVFLSPPLAKEYWPRFARIVREHTHDGKLEPQWRYLLRLGDAATAEMFVDAWRETPIEHGELETAARLLPRIAPPLREQVIGALVECVQHSDANPTSYAQGINPKDRVIATLQAYGHGTVEQVEAERLYAALRTGSQDDQRLLRKNVPLWLAQTEPNSPLVGMLAGSEDADLRLMVMAALREHPTPVHVALLTRLLEDPDLSVRKAAEDTASYLRTLSARKPAEYTSGRTAGGS